MSGCPGCQKFEVSGWTQHQKSSCLCNAVGRWFLVCSVLFHISHYPKGPCTSMVYTWAFKGFLHLYVGGPFGLEHREREPRQPNKTYSKAQEPLIVPNRPCWVAPRLPLPRLVAGSGSLHTSYVTYSPGTYYTGSWASRGRSRVWAFTMGPDTLLLCWGRVCVCVTYMGTHFVSLRVQSTQTQGVYAFYIKNLGRYLVFGYLDPMGMWYPVCGN